MKKKNDIVVIESNEVAEAFNHELSAIEQQLILACLSQSHKDKSVSDQIMYSISTSDFSKVFNIDMNISYDELKSALFSLWSKEIKIVRPYITLALGWVQSMSYSDDERVVSIRFNREILPYLQVIILIFL